MENKICVAPTTGKSDLKTYINWLKINGWKPVILKKTQTEINLPLLLCGGSDIGVNLERDSRELGWIKSALLNKQPIIGICRGMQLLNYYFGGKVSDIPDLIVEDHQSGDFSKDDDHNERLSQKHWVKNLDNFTFYVNSRHHQYCSEVAPNFRVTHISLDIGYIVEGIDDLERSIWSVQWHPERMESQDNIYPLNMLKKV